MVDDIWLNLLINRIGQLTAPEMACQNRESP
jgi:hypothetical protein